MLARRLMVVVVVLAVIAAAGAAPITQAPLSPERFSVMSDGHPLVVWSRRPPAPQGAVLLVHGRTWSSRPDFDLQVPGLRRSVMQSLADRGFATYAVDLRGYGETPRDRTGWLTPRQSADDVRAVLAWVSAQHQTLPPPALVGWSRGGAIAMLVAQSDPRRISALVLFGFVFDPETPYLDTPAPARPLRLRNTASAAASDFVSPAVTPRAVVQAFVTQALKSDPIAMDLKNDGEFNVLDPARLSVPTLLIFGDRDINVPPGEGDRFLRRLRTSRKQMVSLPGADHAAQLEDTHDAWIAAVAGFLRGAR
jgi:alpha-beta hydrolase superfamily lysophospholipase